MNVVFYHTFTHKDHITQIAAVKYDMSTGDMLGCFAIDTVEDEKKVINALLSLGQDATMATYLSGSRDAVEIAVGRYCDKDTRLDWANPNKHTCVQGLAYNEVDGNIGTSLEEAFKHFVKMDFKQPKDCQDHVAACIDIYFAINPVMPKALT
jgi:hypothetical protein